jgi:hypothetical protein
MNKDIRLATNYFVHPKYRKLRKRLGAEGVLSHIQLLTFVGKVMWSGILEDMDAEDIAEAAGWRGNPDEFVDCLLELRLLDKGSKWHEIHNWPKWNSFAMKAEARSRVARANANKRWSKRHKKALKEIEQSQADNANGIADGNADSNAPSPSPPPSPPPSLEGDGGGGTLSLEGEGATPPTEPEAITEEYVLTMAKQLEKEHNLNGVQTACLAVLRRGVHPNQIHIRLLNARITGYSLLRNNIKKLQPADR